MLVAQKTGSLVSISLGDMRIEHVRRFDDVVINTDNDHVVDIHGIPLMNRRNRQISDLLTAIQSTYVCLHHVGLKAAQYLFLLPDDPDNQQCRNP